MNRNEYIPNCQEFIDNWNELLRSDNQELKGKDDLRKQQVSFSN